jgi:single-stranded-DNA-specific exonuclease
MKWNILYTNRKSKRKNKNYHLQLKTITAALLGNRGIKTKAQQDAFLNPTLILLKKEFFNKEEQAKALKRIFQAIKNKEQIIVYSDYDADGITGGTILWETLYSLGAHVMPYVPNRFTDGYGLSVSGIDTILQKYPDTKLIITVDHGITAFSQTKYAKEKGINVIITDHHTIDKKIPSALAVIHTTELSGSGVAYVFSRILKRFQNDQLQQEHLALAAIGTISDLVPLVGANRVIAKFGLEALNKTKRIGLTALIDISGLSGKKLGPYEVGFMLGPRINATGRLSHALDAMRLLCTKNKDTAYVLAQELEETNRERQNLLSKTVEHARLRVSSKQRLLFVFDEQYNEGVIGLVAGRLTEEFYRPSIVVFQGKKVSKASARSVRGYNIIEAIRTQTALLINAGGHPMAAGFTVKTEKLELVAKNLNAHVDATLDKKLLERVLTADCEIPLSLVTKELYEMISKLEPFGVGNPEPVFVSRGVYVSDARTVGAEEKHLKLSIVVDNNETMKQFNNTYSAIAFNKGDLYPKLSPDKSVDIAYSVRINKWNGLEKIELIVRDIAD